MNLHNQCNVDLSRYPDHLITSNGEIRIHCPYCLKRIGKHDTKYHLYINLNHEYDGVTGWFHCYRCDKRGPAKYLFDNIETVSQPNRFEEWFYAFQAGVTDEAHEAEAATIGFPYDYFPLDSAMAETEAYRYCLDRGLSAEDMLFYKLGFGTINAYQLPEEHKLYYAGSGRIVIPNLDENGQCVYWVARTYKNHSLRYRNPKIHNAAQLFNAAHAAEYDEVVICEGPMSAMRAGRNAVATYGKNVTPEQLRQLAGGPWQRHTIAFDGDARSTALRLADRLFYAGVRDIRIVDFRFDEDPASVHDMPDRIKNAIPYDFLNKLRFLLAQR